MKKVIFKITEDAWMYVEGIAILTRRYMRDVMPEKKTGPSNAVTFKLDSSRSVNEVIIVNMYHTKTSVVVNASIMVMVDDTPEAQAEHFGTRDIRN